MIFKEGDICEVFVISEYFKSNVVGLIDEGFIVFLFGG